MEREPITLNELKKSFMRLKDCHGEDAITPFGLTDVFSWRGDYSEVAFSLDTDITIKQSLSIIDKAYTDHFYGYKGGLYSYDDNTRIHFEKDSSSYSEEDYLKDFPLRTYLTVYPKKQKREEKIMSRNVYLIIKDFGAEGQSIECVFSTRKLTEKFLREQKGNPQYKDAKIEEWVVDPEIKPYIVTNALAKLTEEEKKALGLI